MIPVVRNAILRSTVLISVASLASRVLGLVRENLLSARFGALGDGTLDAYYAAFRVPDFVFNVVILSAGSAVLIPVFSRSARQGDETLSRVVSNIVNGALAGLSVVTLLALAVLPTLADGLTPGFDQARKAETLSLMRIMLLSPLFFGLSGILGSYLNVRRDFTSSILSPVAYNLALIASIVVLAPRWGTSGLAWGVVAGSLLHVVVQLPALRRLGFAYRTVLRPRAEEWRETLRMAVPRLFGIGAAQGNLVVDTVIAGLLPAGSITVLNWVQNMQYLPLGLVGISVSITAFSVLSEQAAADDPVAFRTTLRNNLLAVLLFILPLSVFLVMLRVPAIDLLLNYGRFAAVPGNLSLSSSVLLSYAVSLPLQALLPLLNRSLFALSDTRSSAVAAVGSMVVNVVLSVLLTLRLGWGLPGLGVAFSVATLVNGALLWRALDRYAGFRAPWADLALPIRNMGGATLVCAVATWSVATILSTFIEPGKALSAIVLVSATASGALAYLLALRAFGLLRGLRPQWERHG